MSLPGPSDTLAEFDAAFEQLADPAQREIATVWRQHYYGEVIKDTEMVMDTMAPDPHYRSFGVLWHDFIDVTILTTDETRSMYEEFFASGAPIPAVKDVRFGFGADGVMMEGLFLLRFPGEGFRVDRLPEGTLIDPGKDYLASCPSCHIYPFDAATTRMLGETFYWGMPLQVEALASDETIEESTK